MARLLFLLSVLYIVGRILFAPVVPSPELFIRLEDNAGRSPDSLLLAVRNDRWQYVYSRTCLTPGPKPANIVVERQLGEAWYTHRRLVNDQCARDYITLRPGDFTRAWLYLPMAGRYRVLVFMERGRTRQPFVVMSPEFTSAGAAPMSQLSAAPAASSASPPASR